jgi:hypothetical protein
MNSSRISDILYNEPDDFANFVFSPYCAWSDCSVPPRYLFLGLLFPFLEMLNCSTPNAGLGGFS